MCPVQVCIQHYFLMEITSKTFHVENKSIWLTATSATWGFPLLLLGWPPPAGCCGAEIPHRLENVNQLPLLCKGEIKLSIAQRLCGSWHVKCYRLVLIWLLTQFLLFYLKYFFKIDSYSYSYPFSNRNHLKMTTIRFIFCSFFYWMLLGEHHF